MKWFIRVYGSGSGSVRHSACNVITSRSPFLQRHPVSIGRIRVYGSGLGSVRHPACNVIPSRSLFLQRHPVSIGRVSFAINWLDCAAYELYV